MVSKNNKRIAAVRDAFALVMSTVIIGSSYGKWTTEPVFYVVDGLSAVFIALSVVDLILIARNTKSRAFYFANAIYQLFPSFIFTPLIPYAGGPLLILNILVLVTLRQKKAAPPPADSPAPTA